MLSQSKLKDKMAENIKLAQGVDGDKFYAVQTITWVCKKKDELMFALGNSHDTFNSSCDVPRLSFRYLLLEKNTDKNRGKLVFPGGSIDDHEILDNLNPNGLILAGIRETQEETLGLLRLTANDYVNTYPNKIYDVGGRNMIMFRLLAVLGSEQVEGFDEKYQEFYSKVTCPQYSHYPEHSNLYLVQAKLKRDRKLMFDYNLTYMDSVVDSVRDHILSLIE